MCQASMKPRALIIGLGSYFRKLRQGLEQHFEITCLADCRPSEDLDLTLTERPRFRQVSVDLDDLTVDDAIDCILLLTPPAFHVPHIARLARFQKPMLVEKPVATSAAELPRLKQAVARNPRLYCSDFYPDVRALPLLAWAFPQQNFPLRSEIHLVSGESQLWQAGLAGFGAVQRVEGKLLEGAGAAASFEGREWLWEPAQGGVLLDLMSHYLTLSACLFDEALIPHQVELKTWRESDDLGQLHPVLDLAETYALVEGQFGGGAPFSFEVAKYWKADTERRFTLYCTLGVASMLFKDPNVLVLESKGARCEVRLEGSYYHHVARRFSDYVRAGELQPHGLGQALRAVETIDEIKRIALMPPESPPPLAERVPYR